MLGAEHHHNPARRQAHPAARHGQGTLWVTQLELWVTPLDELPHFAPERTCLRKIAHSRSDRGVGRAVNPRRAETRWAGPWRSTEPASAQTRWNVLHLCGDGVPIATSSPHVLSGQRARDRLGAPCSVLASR